jgi:hypothetical protein
MYLRRIRLSSGRAMTSFFLMYRNDNGWKSSYVYPFIICHLMLRFQLIYLYILFGRICFNL